MALLDAVIMGVDLRPHLDLFDLDASLALTGFLQLHRPLVFELAVIHDPAHWRLGLGGHFNQVEVQFLGPAQRVLDRHDADLRSVRAHQSHLGSADPVVHAWLNRDASSPPAGGTCAEASALKEEDRLPSASREYREEGRHEARTGPRRARSRGSAPRN